MTKKLFVDLTSIIEHDHKTGIQRVVRELTKAFTKSENGFDFEFVPFVFTRAGTRRLSASDLPWLSGKPPSEAVSIEYGGETKRNRASALLVVRDVAKNLFYRTKVSISKFLRNDQVTHFLLGSATRRGTLNAYLTLGRKLAPSESTVSEGGIESAIAASDVVLLLDSSWEVVNFQQRLEGFSARGARVVSLIYDVIPLSHTQFVVPDLVKVFRESFDVRVRCADQIIVISASELVTVKKFILDDPNYKARKRPLEFGFFHLGCNLPENSHGASGLPDHFLALKSGGLDEAHVFVCVGTIEPRKNLDVVLDGFFQVWLKRRDVVLVLVGKPGWKTEQLQNRIRTHPLANKNLFWTAGLSDSGLRWLYENCDYLLQASQTEGFGLPIVEARVAGKSVLCSDIPVFHEVGGDDATFFDPNDSISLAEKVNMLSDRPRADRSIHANRAAWITWDESAKQLVNVIYNQKD